ncbi:hypothetical protein H6G89_04940 [Oscillatoria sp. FACHB-1407]|uniref:DUF6391 domain-containing protein n=1 Tax=Oscillatoria sp. FACHB-1407 TaxID=2692847 RepID=UPI0016898E5A|nr:DUF6391 domain-containing protein [Oscillatoria sp. FACHB-1407]MBD2460384.1 hypothetical protein [Oscillatoria sp. FACHB-1407]
MVSSTNAQSNSFPLDFSPHLTQDTELLQQLSFIPGLKEMLMLRQVHALEHATVWVLGESPSTQTAVASRLLGGMSTDQGFYLYGAVDSAELHRAVYVALRRLTHGEWDLAVHPRCGTNLSVGVLLTAGLALGITWLIPKGPIEQLAGLGMAAIAGAQLAPDVGAIVQQYVTTSIPFNLAIEEISTSRDRWGRPVHFVRVRWVEPQKY